MVVYEPFLNIERQITQAQKDLLGKLEFLNWQEQIKIEFKKTNLGF